MTENSFLLWLQELPSKSLDSLYNDQWNAQMVFQALSPLAKQYVMRMLCLDSLPISVMESWLLPAGKESHVKAMRTLRALRIIQTSSDDADSVFLHRKFQEQFKAAVSNLQMPWQAVNFFQNPTNPPPSPSELCETASAKWNAVLHHLVGSSSGLPLTQSMRQILLDTKLVREKSAVVSLSKEKSNKKEKKKGKLTITFHRKSIKNAIGKGDKNVVNDSKDISSDGSPPAGRRLRLTQNKKHEITSVGYEFLLQGTREQIWRFLKRYFLILRQRDADMASAVGLIIRLGFCTLGEAYSVEFLSQTQKSMLSHLEDFGMVHRHHLTVLSIGGKRFGKKGKLMECFFPTSFGINLLNGFLENQNERKNIIPSSNVSSTEIVNDTFSLVVETNFRIYAYTNSELHVYMLKLFANLLYRLPNMVLAVITRASATSALKAGISAKQICQFLKQNAHPQMINSALAQGGNGCLPENVVDQLYLWERERKRVSACPAGYIELRNANQAKKVQKWARAKKVLLWANRISIVVRSSHLQACKDFVGKPEKAENGSLATPTTDKSAGKKSGSTEEAEDGSLATPPADKSAGKKSESTEEAENGSLATPPADTSAGKKNESTKEAENGSLATPPADTSAGKKSESTEKESAKSESAKIGSFNEATEETKSSSPIDWATEYLKQCSAVVADNECEKACLTAAILYLSKVQVCPKSNKDTSCDSFRKISDSFGLKSCDSVKNLTKAEKKTLLKDLTEEYLNSAGYKFTNETETKKFLQFLSLADDTENEESYAKKWKEELLEEECTTLPEKFCNSAIEDSMSDLMKDLSKRDTSLEASKWVNIIVNDGKHDLLYQCLYKQLLECSVSTTSLCEILRKTKVYKDVKRKCKKKLRMKSTPSRDEIIKDFVKKRMKISNSIQQVITDCEKIAHRSECYDIIQSDVSPTAPVPDLLKNTALEVMETYTKGEESNQCSFFSTTVNEESSIQVKMHAVQAGLKSILKTVKKRVKMYIANELQVDSLFDTVTTIEDEQIKCILWNQDKFGELKQQIIYDAVLSVFVELSHECVTNELEKSTLSDNTYDAQTGAQEICSKSWDTKAKLKSMEEEEGILSRFTMELLKIYLQIDTMRRYLVDLTTSEKIHKKETFPKKIVLSELNLDGKEKLSKDCFPDKNTASFFDPNANIFLTLSGKTEANAHAVYYSEKKNRKRLKISFMGSKIKIELESMDNKIKIKPLVSRGITNSIGHLQESQIHDLESQRPMLFSIDQSTKAEKTCWGKILLLNLGVEKKVDPICPFESDPSKKRNADMYCTFKAISDGTFLAQMLQTSVSGISTSYSKIENRRRHSSIFEQEAEPAAVAWANHVVYSTCMHGCDDKNNVQKNVEIRQGIQRKFKWKSIIEFSIRGDSIIVFADDASLVLNEVESMIKNLLPLETTLTLNCSFQNSGTMCYVESLKNPEKAIEILNSNGRGRSLGRRRRLQAVEMTEISFPPEKKAAAAKYGPKPNNKVKSTDEEKTAKWMIIAIAGSFLTVFTVGSVVVLFRKHACKKSDTDFDDDYDRESTENPVCMVQKVRIRSDI
eukprot:g3050.t1